MTFNFLKTLEVSKRAEPNISKCQNLKKNHEKSHILSLMQIQKLKKNQMNKKKTGLV